MALEKELETYKIKLPELLACEGEGKFALIHGDQLIDVFGTYEDAIKDGYAKFRLEPFLVKRIESCESVHFVSRLVTCPTSLAR
jgi:hypothetical protein